MFLKDNNKSNILPVSVTVSRQDSNPFIIAVSGDNTSPTEYDFDTSSGHHYHLKLGDGYGLWKLTGDISDIEYIKATAETIYNTPNNDGNFSNLRVGNVNPETRSPGCWTRSFAGKILNGGSLSEPAQEVYSIDQTGSHNSNMSAYTPTNFGYFSWEYYYRPKFLAQDGSGYWISIDGKFNNRSGMTFFPFNAWYPSDGTLQSPYMGNSWANTDKLQRFYYKLEICEKNLGKTSTYTPETYTITYHLPSRIIWDGITPKASFESWDPSFIVSEQLTHNSGASRIPKFLGWARSLDGEPQKNYKINPKEESGDIDLYAIFEEYYLDFNWINTEGGVLQGSNSPYACDIYIDGTKVSSQTRDHGCWCTKGQTVTFNNFAQKDNGYILDSNQAPSITRQMNWSWTGNYLIPEDIPQVRVKYNQEIGSQEYPIRINVTTCKAIDTIPTSYPDGTPGYYYIQSKIRQTGLYFIPKNGDLAPTSEVRYLYLSSNFSLLSSVYDQAISGVVPMDNLAHTTALIQFTESYARVRYTAVT